MLIAVEFVKLAELRRSGALTKTAFCHANARLLDSQPCSFAHESAALGELCRSSGDRGIAGVRDGVARATGLQSALW